MFSSIVLFFIVISIFFVSYLILKDFFSPPCLVCESILFALLCASLSSGILGWDFSFSIDTIIVVFCGLFFYLIGACVSIVISSQIKVSIRSQSEDCFDYIKVKRQTLKCIFVLHFCLFAIYIYYLIKSYSQFMGLDFGSMINTYRVVSKYGDGMGNGLANPIPGIVGYFPKFFLADALIAGYILMYNAAIRSFYKRKKTKDYLLRAIVVMYILSSIASASRFETVSYVLFCMIVWIFVFRKCRGSSSSGKLIRKIIPTILIVFIAFSVVGNILNSSGNGMFLGEVINYFGRSIKCLDVAITDNVHTSIASENESFFAFTKLLKQIGIVSGDIGSLNLPFITLNGVSMGNTYSAFRRAYVDMGLAGTVLISFFSGCIFTSIYKRAVIVKKDTVDLGLLFYGELSFCMFLYAYDEYFWSTIISFNYFTIFLFTFIIWNLLISRRRKKVYEYN